MNFKRSDLIALTALAVVLAALGLAFISSMSVNRAKAGRNTCVNNLKQIGLSFRIWSNDCGDRFPMLVADDLGGAMESVGRGEIARIFQVMSNELSTPRTVICPADSERIGNTRTNWAELNNTNISYFVGLDAKDTRPNMLLSGDRNLATNGVLLSGTVELGTNIAISYTTNLHDRQGHVLLADGSVQQMTASLLSQQLQTSGDTTNRVLFPQ